MTRIRGVRRYLRLPRSVGAQAREDVESEIRFHLEMRTEELVASGLAPHQARERAEEEFGDLDSAAEYCRRQSKRRERKVRGLDSLLGTVNDIRFAGRMLLRNRGFTAVVLATIALGIGANTAIFSVVNAVLLRPFPFEEPDRLVTLWESNPGEDLTFMTVAPPNFADWREECGSFEDMAAWASRTWFLDQGEGPIQVQGTRMTNGLFEILRVTPQMGRTITPEEDHEGAERVVIVSHRFWNGRLGADPAALGSDIVLDEIPHRIIGIMPAGFSFPPPISLEGPAPPESDIWVPLRIDTAGGSRRQHFMHVIGRLAPGVTVEQARTEVIGLAERLQLEYPESNTGWTAAVVPLDEKVFGDLRTPLLLILGAVGFVLLIACVNVAKLLLARGATRQRELATRAALGAGRSRLTGQLMAESMLLAFTGGALGLAAAFGAVELLVVIAPQSIPRLQEASVDLTVAGFTFVISIVTGLLFGLAPALQGRRTNLVEQMREGGARAGSGSRTNRFRSALIVAEIALSLILLFGAGLMLRSFQNLQGVEKGFEADNVLTLRLTLPGSRYDEDQLLVDAYRRIEEEVAALPGVLSAGMIFDVPLGGDRQGTGVIFEGEPPPQSMADLHLTNFTISTPGYFGTMGIQLLQGRDFTGGDVSGSERVAIVNSMFTLAYSSGIDPLTRRLIDLQSGEPVRIIGVVEDVRHSDLAVEPTPVVYMPYYQEPWDGSMSLVIRTAGPPEELFDAVRQRILAVDRGIPIYEARTLDDIVGSSVAEPRFTTILLGLFSALALILALVGIYGLVRYSVSQRVQEIGIRTALGAVSGDIIRMVVWQGMRLTLAGVAAGVVAALLLARVLASQLFEVQTADPVTLVTVPLLLAGAALAATWLPAMRAAGIDPIRALREE